VSAPLLHRAIQRDETAHERDVMAALRRETGCGNGTSALAGRCASPSCRLWRHAAHRGRLAYGSYHQAARNLCRMPFCQKACGLALPSAVQQSEFLITIVEALFGRRSGAPNAAIVRVWARVPSILKPMRVPISGDNIARAQTDLLSVAESADLTDGMRPKTHKRLFLACRRRPAFSETASAPRRTSFALARLPASGSSRAATLRGMPSGPRRTLSQSSQAQSSSGLTRVCSPP
jgi:hypothetical protein